MVPVINATHFVKYKYPRVKRIEKEWMKPGAKAASLVGPCTLKYTPFNRIKIKAFNTISHGITKNSTTSTLHTQVLQSCGSEKGAMLPSRIQWTTKSETRGNSKSAKADAASNDNGRARFWKKAASFRPMEFFHILSQKSWIWQLIWGKCWFTLWHFRCQELIFYGQVQGEHGDGALPTSLDCPPPHPTKLFSFASQRCSWLPLWVGTRPYCIKNPP